MSRKPPQSDAEKQWRILERWLAASDAEGRDLAPADPASFKWENDRAVLQWAIETTPASTPRGLQVKALAALAFSRRDRLRAGVELERAA